MNSNLGQTKSCHFFTHCPLNKRMRSIYPAIGRLFMLPIVITKRKEIWGRREGIGDHTSSW
jgi:hypothetical protein